MKRIMTLTLMLVFVAATGAFAAMHEEGQAGMEQDEQLKQMSFEEFDADGNDSITASEYEDAVGDRVQDKSIQPWDENGDGTLNQDEFENARSEGFKTMERSYESGEPMDQDMGMPMQEKTWGEEGQEGEQMKE